MSCWGSEPGMESEAQSPRARILRLLNTRSLIPDEVTHMKTTFVYGMAGRGKRQERAKR